MKSKFTKYLENFFIIAVSLLFLVFFILQVTSRDEFSPWNNKVEILKEDAGLLLEDGTVIPIEEKDDTHGCHAAAGNRQAEQSDFRIQHGTGCWNIHRWSRAYLL